MDSIEVDRLVYLDVCALERPFDDPRQLRIVVEAASVMLIIAAANADSLRLLWSPVHTIEISAMSNLETRKHLELLLSSIGTSIVPDDQVLTERVAQLRTKGIRYADAIHFACAELAQADFVTCDDRLLGQLKRLQTSIWFGTPPAYCAKEGLA